MAEAFGEGVPVLPPPVRCGTDSDVALCGEVVGPVCFLGGGVVTDLFFERGIIPSYKGMVCVVGEHTYSFHDAKSVQVVVLWHPQPK